MNEGDYLEVDYSGGKGAEAGVYDKAKTGAARQDNIQDYGNEAPTAADKQEVGAVLEERD